MNLDEIKKLVRLVEKSDISEIEIEEDGKKIKITKSSAPQPIVENLPAVQVIPPPPPVAATPSATAPTVEAPADDDKYHGVKSPIVGTFYRSPGEDSPPFVKEGDIVDKGQTLCIIEAMKLMNEIESDVKGKVIRVLIENASPVEYGERLFNIEPI